jgi:hypothetical protein
VVGVQQGVQVLLGGLDLRVPHSLHHTLEVRPAGEQPRGVGVGLSGGVPR